MKRFILFSIKTKLILAGSFLFIVFSSVSFYSIAENKRNAEIFSELTALRSSSDKIHEVIELVNSLTLLEAKAALYRDTDSVRATQRALYSIADTMSRLDKVDMERQEQARNNFLSAAASLQNDNPSTDQIFSSITNTRLAYDSLREIEHNLEADIRTLRQEFRGSLVKNPYDSLWILFSAYALLLAIALVVVKDIFSPLHQITQKLRAAADDTSKCMDYIIPETRTDEVGIAQQALNQLLRNTTDNLNALRLSNYIAMQRLAAIELIRDGVGIADENEILVYANAPFFVKHDIDPSLAKNYIGQPWHRLLSNQDAERIELLSWRSLERDRKWEGEVRIHPPGGGDKLLEMAITRMPDGNTLRTVRDITLNREAEIERAKLQELFGQSQKMEAIGRLTGGVAHDFNNILTIIGGNLDLMKDSLSDTDEMRHILIAERAILRGSELTQQLLSFSKKQVLSPKVININSLLPDMLTLLSRATGEDVDILFDMAENLWNVRIDAGQLETAMLNLIINSRDAMSNGGVIQISTENIWLRETEKFVHFIPKPGPYVKLCIADSGSGITKENISKVFEPFFSTKEKGKGTGLGLSMVYGFGKQSGGYIDIQSEENVGTKVSLFFPRHEAEATEPLSVETLHSHLTHTPNYETILVVEDEEDVLELNRSILERAGFKVICAANGVEAMKIMEKQGISVDVLLTDMVMPGGVGGKELAEFTKKIRPDIKIIMVSGYAYDHIEELESDPNSRFIYKPYSQKKLISELSSLLNNQDKRATN